MSQLFAPGGEKFLFAARRIVHDVPLSTDVALDPDVSPSTYDPYVYVAVDPDASDLPSSHTSQG